MGIPADQIMALTQRCAQAEVDRDKARARVAELEGQISAFDCRLVGRVGELSGSHCPADRPCDRCIAERRIEELSHAYAVQGLALEDLTAERDRYREALRPFAALDPYKWGSEERVAILAARAALKEPTKRRGVG